MCGICHAKTYEITSPNSQAKLSVIEEQGTLYYELKSEEKVLIRKSEIGVIPQAKLVVHESSTSSKNNTWKPIYGQFSTIVDNYSQLKLELGTGDQSMALIARLFDDGMGIRFIVNGEAGQNLNFSCDFALNESDVVFFPAGESEPYGPSTIKGDTSTGKGKSRPSEIQIPMVIKRSADSYIALLESDLYSAKTFNSMTFRAKGSGYTSSSLAKTMDGETLTPWRVVLFGKTAGSLLTSTASLNLAAPNQIEDPSWIKPGKGLWDWRIHGYDNGKFKYDINTQSYIHLIDFCAEQNITYLTIDDHWFKSGKTVPFDVDPNVDMQRVMAHAKDKGVRIKLYYDRKKGYAGDEKLFSYYQSLNASGIKYGFMGNKATFTRHSIEAAAAHRQVINFHDNPTPMVGVERTMPNLISREYCHAQQDCRRAFTPRGFLKMAMINALIGPMDQANGNFGINSINAGERKKGPSKKNSYISTVVSECARTLVVFSGLITLPDAPEEYLKKADLFEFLKQMPATWDETVVPNSEIGRYITTARRTGKTWFVGSVNDETPRTLAVKCDFLTEGVTYLAMIFEDAKDADGLTNPEVYQIRTMKLKKGDVVHANMVRGGGHAMIIRSLSSMDSHHASAELQAAEFEFEYRGVAVQKMGKHVWGTSPIVGPDGKIHVYVAQWPTDSQRNFSGWYKDCEIAHYVADSPEGPYEFLRVAVEDQDGDFNSPHNPTISYIDGRYVLCFIVNEHNDLKTQRIVMYVADDLSDNWRPAAGAKRDGTILKKSSNPEDWNAKALLGVSNPSLIKHKGKYMLYNKSVLKRNNQRAWIYGVAISANLEGPYKHYPRQVTAPKMQLEDTYAFVMNDEVYMISRDFRGAKGSKSGGLLWKSPDGLFFPEKDTKRSYEGLSHYIQQEELMTYNVFRGDWHGHLERPQILFKDGKPDYLVLAVGINNKEGYGSCSHVFKINHLGRVK